MCLDTKLPFSGGNVSLARLLSQSLEEPGNGGGFRDHE